MKHLRAFVRLAVRPLGRVVAGSLIAVLCIACVAIVLFRFTVPDDETVNRLCSGENFTINSDLNVSWVKNVSYGVADRVVVANGVGFLIDRRIQLPPLGIGQLSVAQDSLVSFDLKTGAILWTYPAGEPIRWIEHVSVADQRISFYAWQDDRKSKIVVLTTADGNLYTEFPADVLDLYITSHYLVLRDWTRTTRFISLKSKTEVKSLIPDIVASGKQFYYAHGRLYSVYGDELTIFDEETLREEFSSKLTRYGRSPAFPQGFIVYNDQLLTLFGDSLTSYNPVGAYEEWSSYLDYDIKLWPPAFDNNEAYLFSESGGLVKVDLMTGNIIAQSQNFMPNEGPISAPVYFGGRVFAVFADGTLRSFDPITLTNRIDLTNTVIRYSRTEPGGYYHYFPSVSAANDLLFVSFGCKQLVALTSGGLN